MVDKNEQATRGESDEQRKLRAAQRATEENREELAKSREREQSLAEEKRAQGITQPEDVYVEQVKRAGAEYTLTTTGAPSSPEHEVREDLSRRMELASSKRREVPNEELGTLRREEVNTIREDEKVSVEVRNEPNSADNPTSEEDLLTGIEDLEQEALVKRLAESGRLFEKGGPIGNWDGKEDSLSDAPDGLFLAERSKQTGEKLF